MWDNETVHFPGNSGEEETMHNFYLSDLDKTLLKSDLSVGEYTRRVWNESVAKGARLSVATARSLTGVCRLLKDLRITEPMILLDGVLIATMEGELRHVAALDRLTAQEIIGIGQEMEMEPLLVSLEEDGLESFVYPRRPNRWQRELLATFHNDRRVLDTERMEAGERTLKIVYLHDEEHTARLERRLREALGSAIEIKRSKDPYIDCWFMTVLHPEGDKAHALAKLEEMEGVDRRHTTVFGDSHNDLGLFEMAGRRIAVANAIDELKARADLVLPWSNDEEGVARFLEGELLE